MTDLTQEDLDRALGKLVVKKETVNPSKFVKNVTELTAGLPEVILYYYDNGLTSYRETIKKGVLRYFIIFAILTIAWVVVGSYFIGASGLGVPLIGALAFGLSWSAPCLIIGLIIFPIYYFLFIRPSNPFRFYLTSKGVILELLNNRGEIPLGELHSIDYSQTNDQINADKVLIRFYKPNLQYISAELPNAGFLISILSLADKSHLYEIIKSALSRQYPPDQYQEYVRILEENMHKSTS